MRRLLLITLLLLAFGLGAGVVSASLSLRSPPIAGSILYLSERAGFNEHMEVDAVDTAGGARVRLLTPGAWAASWSPDGTRIAFLRWVPSTDPVLQHFADHFDLYVQRADQGGLKRVATGLARGASPDRTFFAWSPDGRKIAYALESPGDTNRQQQVWTVDANGRHRELVADEAAGPLAWSPDGRWIAYLRTRGAGAGISLIHPDGTHVRLLTRFECSGLPSWSPSARQLVCSTRAALNLIDVDGTHPRSLPIGGGPAAWSPDGRWIALSSFVAPNGAGTFIVHPDGSGLRRVGIGGYTPELPPAWSPDSRALAVDALTSGPRHAVDIWVEPLTGRAHRITQGWRYGYANWDPQWHPTGAPLARLRGPYVSPALASDSVQVGNVLKTTHPVAALAADGSHAAIAYDAGSSASFSAAYSEAWGPTSKTVTVLGDDYCPCFAIAIAGSRVAELYREQPTIHNDSTGLLTGLLSVPHMQQGSGTVCSGGEGLQCLGLPLGDLRGSGSDIVFDIWTTPCQLSHAACSGRPKTNDRLFRLDGAHATQIASSTGALTPLSVDAGRILVDHEDGTMDIRSTDGATVRSFSFDAASVNGALLQGRDLVVQTPAAVEVTDAETGAFERRWPLPAHDAKLADVQDGIAVLVAGGDIHLLRLSDGADKLIHVSDTGPVLAQLEPSGLFDAHTVDDPVYPGRITFIPVDQLPLR